MDASTNQQSGGGGGRGDDRDRKRKRREERKRLLEQLPKADPETGIAYTKQQLRRMRKRLGRGLDPVESSAERHARQQREAELRREEEAELAGALCDRSSSRKEGEEEEQDKDQNSGDDEGQEGGGSKEDKATEGGPSAAKRPKRTKEVPSDYTCQACHNEHRPAHWIYDCPRKVTVRGRNQVCKRLRGILDPSPRKVFCSGLPFDVKASDVEAVFEQGDCGKVAHCKLVTFPDSRRCKGEAFLTFETEEGAKKALQLNGSAFGNVATTTKQKNKKSKADDKPPRKELKLKVTMALNRTASKQQKTKSP